MSSGKKSGFIQIRAGGYKGTHTKDSSRKGKEVSTCTNRILIDLDGLRRQEEHEQQQIKKQSETGRETSAQTRREARSHSHIEDGKTDGTTPERSVMHVSPNISPSLIKAPKSSRKHSL